MVQRGTSKHDTFFDLEKRRFLLFFHCFSSKIDKKQVQNRSKTMKKAQKGQKTTFFPYSPAARTFFLGLFRVFLGVLGPFWLFLKVGTSKKVVKNTVFADFSLFFDFSKKP